MSNHISASIPWPAWRPPHSRRLKASATQHLEATLTVLLAGSLGAGLELLWQFAASSSHALSILLAAAGASLAWLVFRRIANGWRVSRTFLAWACLLIFCHALAGLQVTDNLRRHGSWLTESDDRWYITTASEFSQELRSAEGWSGYVGTYNTLAGTSNPGYTVLLAHLFAFLDGDERLQIRTALVVNIHSALLAFAIIIRLAGVAGRRWLKFLGLSLTAGFEIFYFATTTLKDSVVLLALLLALWGVLAVEARRKSIFSWLLIASSAPALLFLRATFLFLPAGALALLLILSRRRRRLPVRLRDLIPLAVVAVCLAGFTQTEWYSRSQAAGPYDINNLRERMDRTEGAGYGEKVHRLPVIGPVVFTLISPIPPTPKSLALALELHTFSLVDVARGLSTVATLVVLAGVFLGSRSGGHRLDITSAVFAAVAGAALLFAAYASLEARHKLASTASLILIYSRQRYRVAL
ncbi:MAG: hypothetical protein ACM3PW_00610 [Chlamydiota bacterium]